MELNFNRAYNSLKLTNKRYICLWGGCGSAKSYTAAQDIVINMIEQDYFRCVIARANFSDIRGSQFKQLKDIINGSGMEHLFHIRENTMEIECKLNGNKIIAKGFRASSGSATALYKSFLTLFYVHICVHKIYFYP